MKALCISVVDDLSILGDAVEIAFSRGTTIYAAIYVALAEATSSKLVTYDRELLSKFSNIAVKASQVTRETDPFFTVAGVDPS